MKIYLQEIDKKEMTKRIVYYTVNDTDFGRMLFVYDESGLYCALFVEKSDDIVEIMKEYVGNATFRSKDTTLYSSYIFKPMENKRELWINAVGTSFQCKVWRYLAQIENGKLVTYGQIAKGINLPMTFRAVGTAVGKNPVAVFLPCHRVVLSSGLLGGYKWGKLRKEEILKYEGFSVKNGKIDKIKDFLLPD